MQDVLWAVQGGQVKVDTKETPLRRTSPPRKRHTTNILEKAGQIGSELEKEGCYGHLGKYWGRDEASWSDEHKRRSWQGWVTGCANVKNSGKPFPWPSPLPNHSHQRCPPEGVSGRGGHCRCCPHLKKVKWLQSELSFTPDGPRWSQRGGDKCLPRTLLREGSKWKPQAPAPSDPKLVWRSHVPSCHLCPLFQLSGASDPGTRILSWPRSPSCPPLPALHGQGWTSGTGRFCKRLQLPLVCPRNETFLSTVKTFP